MLLDVGREWTWGAELYQGTDELFVFFFTVQNREDVI